MIFYTGFYDISEGRDGTKVLFISYFTQNFIIFHRVSRWDGGSVYMIFYPEFYDIPEGRDGTKAWRDRTWTTVISLIKMWDRYQVINNNSLLSMLFQNVVCNATNQSSMWVSMVKVKLSQVNSPNSISFGAMIGLCNNILDPRKNILDLINTSIYITKSTLS